MTVSISSVKSAEKCCFYHCLLFSQGLPYSSRKNIILQLLLSWVTLAAQNIIFLVNTGQKMCFSRIIFELKYMEICGVFVSVILIFSEKLCLNWVAAYQMLRLCLVCSTNEMVNCMRTAIRALCREGCRSWGVVISLSSHPNFGCVT